MTAAEIITIGTELLLGEIVDTNTRYIARVLRDCGVDIYRTTTVGDNIHRISQTITEATKRSDIIITTGGLGPTVDDPTRDAVARAFDVDLEFRFNLWEQIQERFQRFGHIPTKNNKRQAYVPAGAIAIENMVGTAPAFIVETKQHAVISLPGVPREMEHLMQNEVIPYLRRRFNLSSIIKSRLLHTAGVGESQIDHLIGDFERLSNPTVGLAAHAGQVDIRITAKAKDEKEADSLIRPVEEKLRDILNKWLFGVDNDTLSQVAVNNIASHNWNLVGVEIGLGGRLIQQLADTNGPFIGGEILASLQSPHDFYTFLGDFRVSHNAKVCLGVMLQPDGMQSLLNIAAITPDDKILQERTYGGPPQLAPIWAVNLSLDLLRKL